MLDMGCRPSEMMDIDDPYTAFCFDEACARIIQFMNEEKKPVIKQKMFSKENHYKKSSDVFSKYSNVNIK